MYRALFRFVVTTITILTANLITNMISDYLVSYKNHYKPIAFTLIAMGIITLVFYPLFLQLENWIGSVSIRFIKKGKSVGGKYIGLLLAFLAALLILLYFYARMWYHIDILRLFLKGDLTRVI